MPILQTLLLCPGFWITHRHLLLCLSQIAAGLTVGMITATEVRNAGTQGTCNACTCLRCARMPPAALPTSLHSARLHPCTPVTAPWPAGQVYRREWSGLLRRPGQQQLLARPSMLVAWFYVVVPLLQQMPLPEQAVSCISQAAQTYMAVRAAAVHLHLAVCCTSARPLACA